MNSTLIVLLTFVITTAVLAKNYSWGKRTPDDHLLQTGLVLRSCVKGRTHSVKINYPAKSFVNNLTLTFINVTDNFKRESPVTVYLKSGGPGFKNATLNFRSKKNKGFNATLSFYGRSNKTLTINEIIKPKKEMKVLSFNKVIRLKLK